jgi:hypothetical protein
MSKRIPTRIANGQYARPTLAGTCGLGNIVCDCGGCNPWKIGVESKPWKCGHCGALLAPHVAASPLPLSEQEGRCSLPSAGRDAGEAKGSVD